MKSLQSLSYKTLLIIFFFSIAGIIFFLKIGGKTTKVSAAWWNESWNYRRSILISNPSNTNLSDFQVSVSIGTSAIIAQGRMKSDCSDIRITDASGNLLPHWIEENNPGCNSASGNTKIWVKANTISASGSTIYVYYGNASATSVENGNNVFDFFDDFSTNLNKWSNPTGYDCQASIISGYLNIPANTQCDTYPFKALNLNLSDNPGYILDLRGKYTSGGSNRFEIYQRHRKSNDYWARFWTYDPSITYYQEYTTSGSSNTNAGANNMSAGTWYNIGVQVNGNNNSYFINGTLIGSVTSSSSLSSFSDFTIGLGEYQTAVQYDNVRIRKYASSQPTTTLNSEEVSSGPIAYWKFDEGTGTTAFDSAGSNDGTISSATYTSESQCISGKCLNFDGSNDIIDTGSTFASLTSAFTISAWVNPGATQVAYADIFGNHGSSSGYNGIVFQQNNATTNQYFFGYGNGSAWVNTNYFNLNASTWQYVSVVKDTNGVTVYVDGIVVANSSSTTSVTPSTYTLKIGQGYASGGRYFKGKIDEFKIYRYARTAAQIKNDYNSRGSVNSSSVNLGIKSSTAPDLNSKLVAYWKLDEGVSATAHDSVGSNNGTFGTGSSAPTWVSESQCVSGKCLSFDGVNDYVDISSSVPRVSTSFTVSVWFKQNGAIPDLYYGALISKNDAGSGYHDNYNLWVDKTTTKLVGRIGFGSTEKLISSTVSTNDGRWHYGALSANYNGANTIMILYLDGKIVDQATQSGAPYTAGTYANIGKWSTTAQFFPGYIDEVKIYNATLTADEVKQDYNQGSAIKFGATTQTIGATTTSLNYCIPGDATYCASPVAEYNFEENTGTVANDTSGNNYNATFGTGSSAPTWTTGQNNKGSGLSFDGVNDYVRAPLPTTQIDNWTISAWIKSNSASGIAGAVHVGGPGCTGYSISMSGGNWYPLFSCVNWNNTTAIAPVTVGQWTHITVVRDNGVLRAYANGVKTVTGVTTTPISPSGNYLNIGMVEAGNFFNGSIDQVKIYNYARTDAQVTYDYNRGKPIAQYKFDECQGTTVYNSISAGSTGVIVIGSSGTQNSLGICQIGTSAAWTNGANGKFNSSLNFDGTDDYVNLGNNTTITASTSQKSISVWIKVTGGESTWRAIISPSSSDFFHFQINNSNTLEVYFYGPAKSATSTTLFNSGNFNKWFHVTAVWDGTYAKLYINGNEENRSTAGSGSLTAATSNLYIGNGYNLSRPFNGQIDDVRIYNYALTNEQVKQIYNGGAINFQ